MLDGSNEEGGSLKLGAFLVGAAAGGWLIYFIGNAWLERNHTELRARAACERAAAECQDAAKVCR